MSRIVAITAVALKRFIRERANLFFVFVLPIGIIILVGSQFGGGVIPEMGVHAPANAGPAAETLVASLEESGEVAIVRYDDRDAVVEAVALGNIAIGVDLPDDLSARLAAGENLNVELIAPAGQLIGGYQALLAEAVTAAAQAEKAIRFVVAEGADRDEAAAAVAELIGEASPITVQTTEIGESLFQGVGGQFEIGATSQLILFMFLTGLTGSAALIQSRRYGVTRRMLGTPTSAFTVVAGEGIGRFAVVLVQGLYILLATTLMFQIDWGNLLGAAAIILSFCAVGAGAAMLFGTLFRNDQQAAGVGVVTGLGLAALGGCMVPIELFPPAMETVARFTPHAWALDAFAELQRRDGTLVDILPQLGVILAFAALLIGLATWRMRATLGTSTA